MRKTKTPDFAPAIAHLMHEADLGPRELSVKCGVSTQAIYLWLSGQTEAPKSDVLCTLVTIFSEALGRDVTAAEIIGKYRKPLPRIHV